MYYTSNLEADGLQQQKTTLGTIVFLIKCLDSNVKELLGPRFLVQRGCTYQEVEYRTAVLPGCPPHADPHFTYPVALSCHCSTCNTHSDECAHKTSNAGMKCSKPVRHLYPDPEESNYIQSYWEQYE
ncbi:thyroid stimulating hormone subunit beta a isoform X2 [Myxocyprinus asiaticus]|uniref:thyroid stimulating hormone subunit beta a isoform X2 n=1 Tax=Myxocyprinus asiaticus TaxID=70543 RepID=UPI002221CD83|nr:thyroid stimulating hormone subunit beta a isoform X2 [Myxocyprinus asiaticus]